MDFLIAGLGLALLLAAGDLLVRGAVNTSLRLGVPALIVSLTIVAFGTSAPELLISVQAILNDAPGIALGNVVGSNTANILLVLGVPALISGLSMENCDSRKSYVLMLAASLLFIGVCALGPITWLHGLVLLAGLAFVLTGQFRDARAHRRRERETPAIDEPEGADPDLPWWRILLYLALGLIGLPLGASLLIDAATSIAQRFGVSDTVIGLTLVAIGTSLPELATTVVAAIRRQADVALGNVIGSNMFNLLAIIGLASLVGNIPVDPSFLTFDLWVMLAASLLLLPFVLLRWHMGRVWGVIFCALYVGYLAVVVT
ncbi:Na+/Ca+ antiporter [Oceaniovalibus guishaninsula JLT2003]|uniref:Na+/Ca+ antiporter n=1 Tax=Oceaniovalibus guishaninsula JLT2003 TaxID=1231392 RepID=K2I3A3_9RHOB|nr:calcium/sodium antiporter [Oceaniovalibus guishaninsula]EKE43375.1 Na+/Ca+ antiporter [Oceaniovalibus guishaninsula JLT2003]